MNKSKEAKMLVNKLWFRKKRGGVAEREAKETGIKKWLGKETKSEEETDESSASKQQQ